jgi:hypothetical protein
MSLKSIVSAIALMLMMVCGTTAAYAQGVVSNKKAPVVDVKRTAKMREVTKADGTTGTWNKTNTDSVSFEQKFAQVYQHQRTTFNPTLEDVEGKLRHNLCFNAGPVGAYLMQDEVFLGGVSVSLEYELRSFIVGVQAFYLWGNKNPDDATSDQRYSGPSVQAVGGLKFWQSDRYTDYLAVMATAGYSFQQTDAKGTPVSSRNYGLAGSLSLRYVKSLGSGMSLLLQGGCAAYPLVKMAGGDQTFRIGPQATVGLQISLSKR